MSVKVGSATRFAGGARAEMSRGIRGFTTKPLPPKAYQGLRSGKAMGIQYDDAQAFPIDGSDELLRSLSPFVLKVELPIVFQGNSFTEGGKVRRGIYEAARAGRDLSNRNYNLPAIMPNYFPGSSEQYISNGELFDASKSSADPVSFDGQYSGRIGTPTLNDVFTALDVAQQLSSIAASPPLVLLINPQSVSMSYEKTQTFQEKSREGYIHHTWGENLPRMNITAKCGAFLAGGKGASFFSKKDSASWQNFNNLFSFYAHNGYIHDTLNKSNAHHFVGGITIQYDNWQYFGNIETLSYSEDASTTANGGIEFQMQFTVVNEVDLHTQTRVSPLRSPDRASNDQRLETNVAQPRESGGLSEPVMSVLSTLTTAVAPTSVDRKATKTGGSAFVPATVLQTGLVGGVPLAATRFRRV